MSSITIVGCGPGSKEYATMAAINAIADAQIVIGAQRLLDEFANGKMTISYTSVDATIGVIREHNSSNMAVLVTGDPGFYSIVSCIKKHFTEKTLRVIPGLSSISYAFAKLGIPWHNARFISTHKELPDVFSQYIEMHTTVGILTSPRYSPSVLAAMLDVATVKSRKFFVGERLSYSDENLREVPFAELANLQTDPLSVMIIDRTDVS